MTGEQYEKFVKAVLVDRLNISPDDLKSTRESGVTFPGSEQLKHQIDLYHVDGNEIAEYITIIECKYRSYGKIDQEEVAKFAYVKGSIKASKAIMVTNKSFTSGAQALAKAEKIALLIISPDPEIEEQVSSYPADILFDQLQKIVQRKHDCYDMQIDQKIMSDPHEKGLNIIERLLSDPSVRRQVEDLANDPEIRKRANEFLSDNPNIASKAMDFLKGSKW